MVYNEPDFLPLWLKHYGGQVGAAHCYVIDHGSDDGSAAAVPDVNFIRLPRTPHDDTKRAALVANIVSLLLGIYDAVIHTDVDEIVFADPRRYSSLQEFCAANQNAVITAHGFDVLHMRGAEADFDPARPVLAQRHWARFSNAMCKPVLVRKPVTWAPGFHCTDESVVFGDLFLFHLRWFDFNMALRRLQRSRAQAWADPQAAPWQRVPDSEYDNSFNHFLKLPRDETCAFQPAEPPLRDAVDAVLLSQIGRQNDLYRIELSGPPAPVLRIPDSFGSLF
jgi:hypothetical protein